MMLSHLQIPQHLKAGDKVATVSLSWGGAGEEKFRHRYEAGKKVLEQDFGLQVVEMTNTLKGEDFIYNNPQARVDDLHEAFSNPEIKAVISCIGGSDSIRLIDLVDYDLLRKNPKIFLGYSDSTVTNFICLKAGLRSYYGPSILSGFAENGGIHDYLRQSVQKVMFSTDPIGPLTRSEEGWTVEHLKWEVPENQSIRRKMEAPMDWQFIQGKSEVTGRLIGGCTDVFPMMVGTSIWPAPEKWQDAILFLENSEEAITPDNFLYILRNFAAQGILSRAKGILFSRPCNVPLDTFGEYDDMLLKVCQEYKLTDLPIVTRMDFGHTDPMMTLPFGAEATINPLKKTVTINEPGVC